VWRAGLDCLVEDVFVVEEARGQGLGRVLMEGVVARARERGCRRMELDTNERNAAAIALYESFGFSATDNSYGARDIYMRVHLDAGPDA
jgi:GNAT superfamily N-acetyltransferase